MGCLDASEGKQTSNNPKDDYGYYNEHNEASPVVPTITVGDIQHNSGSGSIEHPHTRCT